MRRIAKEEINELSEFLVEQFFENDQYQLMAKGIETQKAKRVAKEVFYVQLAYLYKHGDIFVVDSKARPNISGTIIGIDRSKFTAFASLYLLVHEAKKALQLLSKEELRLLIRNTKAVNEIQDAKWPKKYCKDEPYYFNLFAIAEESRGKGLCREMLENMFAFVKTLNRATIVLETQAEKNVPIYEHFGFTLVETVQTKDAALTEYRMIKTF